MSSFNRYRNRIGIQGFNMSQRALNEGIINYEMYLRNAGNQLSLQITDINEPLITEQTKFVKCTMRDVKFNDEKNFDQKVITVPVSTNMGVGSYVEWQDRTYLVIFEQHKEIPTHRTFVIRYCNATYRCYSQMGELITFPISVHNSTLYSDGIRQGKFLDYENNKLKALISNNSLTYSNVKIGNKIPFGEFNTFKVTSIDDFSMEGLFTVVLEQTLTTPEDIKVPDRIDSKPMSKDIDKEMNMIIGENIKVGMSQKFELKNPSPDIETVDWSISTDISKIKIVNKGLECVVSVPSNGTLVGKSFELLVLNNQQEIAKKIIFIESMF